MGFHVGILTLINFSDLTMGMMMIHLFTFDWDWTTHINQFISEKMKEKKLVKYGFIKKYN
jgi:hypothetical protein